MITSFLSFLLVGASVFVVYIFLSFFMMPISYGVYLLGSYFGIFSSGVRIFSDVFFPLRDFVFYTYSLFPLLLLVLLSKPLRHRK